MMVFGHGDAIESSSSGISGKGTWARTADPKAAERHIPVDETNVDWGVFHG